MLERFTTQARSAVVLARTAAHALGSDAVGTEHVLLGVLGEPSSAGARALAALGVAPDEVRDEVRGWAPDDDGGFAPEDAEALQTLGIDLDEVRRTVEEAFGPGALDREASAGRRSRRGGHISFTPGSKKTLELAVREAVHLGSSSIGTEHILLGLVRDDRCAAARILRAHGVGREDVRAAVIREIAAGGDQPGRTA
ncbi:MAG: Clp protease N-terminal domain-containing protein [Actinomycetota bacterium]